MIDTDYEKTLVRRFDVLTADVTAGREINDYRERWTDYDVVYLIHLLGAMDEGIIERIARPKGFMGG